MAPIELRRLVGPTDEEAFDNPTGTPIFAHHGLSLSSYDSVFDFGCGCGRIARQLLQQSPRPRRYVGIDVHKEMVEWCQRHLSPVDSNFQFFHHDVYAPSYAPRNRLRLAQPFPMSNGECSLVIASSVFTHLFRRQTDYYLHELDRILAPDGLAYTTWFFFDRDSFPFLRDGPFCLFAGEVDPTQAVVYDRRWFIDTVRQLGLRVWSTTPPSIAGHQWVVFLAKRQLNSTDEFPLGEEAAEWVSGATLKRMAATTSPSQVTDKGRVASLDLPLGPRWPQPPALFGPLAELAATRRPFTPASLSLLLSRLGDISWLRRLRRAR
jgi:SAM-dependent methyltransferase